MSLLDGLTYESTPDEVAAAIVEELKRRNYTFEEAVGVIADAKQESGIRMIWHRNRLWAGYFQQDSSYPDRENPKGNVLGFLDRLDVKRTHPKHGDIWGNIFWLQQGPNWPSAEHALKVGRIGYLHEIKAQEQWARNKVTSLWGPRTVDTVTPIIGAPIATPPKGNTVWTGDITWAADVVRPAVAKFAEFPGWRTRGHGDFKDIRGVMVHHMGGRGSAGSIANGRPDLPGPLSQFSLGRDGLVTLIAQGVSWHAGSGSYPWLPANMGNWHLIGIECEGPVTPGINPATQGREPWPDVQIIALRNLCAALLLRLGLGTDRLIGHKDYAGRAQGKWDPWNLDVTGWLADEVGKDMRGFVFPGEDGPRDVPVVTPPPVPAPVPPIDKYAGVLLYRGIVGRSGQVTALQTALKRWYSTIVVDGDFGAHTERAVRDFQRLRPPLAADGIVGPATAAALKLAL